MNQIEQTPAPAVWTNAAGPLPAGQPEFFTALQIVIDHLWDDESAAFAALPPAQRKDHIFYSLQILRKSLASWNSAARPAETAPSTGNRAMILGGKHVR